MPPRTIPRSRPAGFTLIEVMITVAIVAIIAAVALPNYIDYMTRSKLVEAKTNLSDMRTRLEQYFLDNRKYPAECIPSAAGPAGDKKIYLPASMKFFTVTCALADTTYTITAKGNDSMKDFEFTIDQANTRTTTNVPAGWAGKGSSCWVGRKNGDC
jgi:type IV pilus assembly protein PilE